jgi:hypothetical protein
MGKGIKRKALSESIPLREENEKDQDLMRINSKKKMTFRNPSRIICEMGVRNVGMR